MVAGMGSTRRRQVPWLLLAVGAPAAVAAALVGSRGSLLNANVALILVVVVVAVEVGGGRWAGALAAVASTIAFDAFHTLPYLRLRIASGDDVETTVLLLAVGLTVGHLATRERVARTSARAARGEMRHIYRLADLIARGEEPAKVVEAAQTDMASLLHLVDCRFEAASVASPPWEADAGARALWFAPEPTELPTAGAELAVLGRGRVLGRFVMRPIPGTMLSLERRAAALILANQVGAALATPTGRRNHGG